jgi:trk system potassium uptake protein TrkA
MKRFAVIGLGRFGKKLAIALAMSGAEVIAIDKDRSEIELIRDQVSHAVRLDSTDEEALKAQGVDKVDVAIIGIGQGHGGGQGFESAILTVVNLKQMGVKQIYARAEDPIAGEVFTKVGTTEVIYPEIESAQRWAYKLIAPQIGEKIDFAPGYFCAGLQLSSNKGAGQLRLQNGYGFTASAEVQRQSGRNQARRAQQNQKEREEREKRNYQCSDAQHRRLR